MARLPKEWVVIERARELTPQRQVLLTEAYKIAEAQANSLLGSLKISGPHVRFDQLLALPNIEVRMVPDYRLDHLSGITRFSRGHWLIILDKNDVHGRRRYTFAHELKHIIDHPLEKLLYAGWGYGDEDRRTAHIEALCQYFAACFLMPRTWVTMAWRNGIRDIYNLASLFQVSVTAMEVRLQRLGLLDDDGGRDVATYLRRDPPGSSGGLAA